MSINYHINDRSLGPAFTNIHLNTFNVFPFVYKARQHLKVLEGRHDDTAIVDSVFKEALSEEEIDKFQQYDSEIQYNENDSSIIDASEVDSEEEYYDLLGEDLNSIGERSIS